jgi:hypothetical protein
VVDVLAARATSLAGPPVPVENLCADGPPRAR